MSEGSDTSGRLRVTRRTILAGLIGAAGLGNAAAQSGGTQHTIHGGTMALSQSYQVADRLFIGPDSAKSNVAFNAGRMYFATDTVTVYYGDGSSWTSFGLGGGSGDPVDILDGGTEIVANAEDVDFAGSTFNVTNPTTGEAAVALAAGGISNSALANSSVTLAGNSVSLGGSSAVDHADLSNISSDQHHPQIDVQQGGTTVVDGPSVLDFGANFAVNNPTSGEAQPTLANDSVTVAGNTVALGGSSAVAHADLSTAPSDAHHPQIDLQDDGTTVIDGPDVLDVQKGASASNPTGSEVELEIDGPLGLPNHHVNYASGLADAEISRFTLAAGETLEVWRLDCQLKGGGSNANVSLDIYDATNATTLGSTTAGTLIDGGSSPIGTSGSGATILARLSTGASAVDITNTAITRVVG